MSQLESETIKRLVEDEFQGEFGEDATIEVERHNLNDEHRKIVERLDEIMLEGKRSDGIMLKKVDKKTLRVQTDRVNLFIYLFLFI